MDTFLILIRPVTPADNISNEIVLNDVLNDVLSQNMMSENGFKTEISSET